MTTIREGLAIDQTPIIRMESDWLQADVAPTVGGRIINIADKGSGYQFLWHNERLKLERLPAGSEYDPNFYGGVDELLPNDIPETIGGVDSPDHGELWTLALNHRLEGDALVLHGTLPLTGLQYERKMTLRPDSPHIDFDYRIENPTGERREFLWKLHAALKIGAGDVIQSSARTARVVDREWSRWDSEEPFEWPEINGNRADQIPPYNGTMDFFYLYDLEEGRMAWVQGDGPLTFAYTWDKKVFPYAWLFASFGGFDEHYVAILEPCTTMPLSVNEAARLSQCSILEPGQSIETRVTIYAGPYEGRSSHE